MKNDIIAGKFCPLCGSKGVEYGVVNNSVINICKCIQPGTLLSFQFETPEEYIDMYRGDEYHRCIQIEENFPPSIERDEEHLCAAKTRMALTNILLGSINGKCLLDVGCGNGCSIDAAKEYGCDALGVEFCDKIVYWAKNTKNRNITQGSWEETSGKWDIIMINDVIEHLTNPISCLEHMHSLLKKNGILIIELPEYGCKRSLNEGIDWRHIKPRQHIWMPCNEVMLEIFKQLNYEVLHIIRPLNGKIDKITYYLTIN